MTKIRPATSDDAPAIGGIYNHYILHSHATFETEPHDDDYWRDWLGQFAITGRHRALVVEQAGSVNGYATSTRFKERQAYGETVMTSVYLHPEAGGRGLGGQLYDALLAALADEDIHRMLAWVALPNDASVALHRKQGFRDIGTMSEAGFKFGRYIDVLMMEKRV